MVVKFLLTRAFLSGEIWPNRKKKLKQKREFRIHSIITLCDREGAFHILFHHLENFSIIFGC